MENTRFGDFPREVVWYILTHAAQSFISTCKTLCLVNSWCYQLTLPYLFTTVILPGSVSVDNFLAMLFLRAKMNGDKTVTSPNQGALQQKPRVSSESVRNLWMLLSLNRVWRMMALCCNAEHVAMDQYSFQLLICETTTFRSWLHIQDHQPLVERRNRPLQMLIIDADIRWNKDILSAYDRGYESLPASDITHIRLAARSPMLYNDRMLNITPFAQLTHFAIPLYLYDGTLFRARLEQQRVALTRLLDNSTLQMLVGIPARAQDQYLAWEWLRDVRGKHTNAYLVQPSSCGLREEWEDEARGGESVWERAVKYTQKVVEAGCSTHFV